MTDHANILERYNISPKKSLGQNFLVNDEILRSIAGATELIGANVLEVGPGYGALTGMILERSPQTLTLVEYDSEMIKILIDRFKRGDFGAAIPLEASMSHWQVGSTQVTLHKGDILQYTPVAPMKVIANIPYYITSPILFRLLHEVESVATEMIVLMQQEVADKIRESRGFKSSYLSTVLQGICTNITEVMLVNATNFVPPPRVNSSVLHFIRKGVRDIWHDQAFVRVLGAAYLHPRKFLASNLAKGLWCSKSDIIWLLQQNWLSSTVRAGEVQYDQWITMLPSLVGDKTGR